MPRAKGYKRAQAAKLQMAVKQEVTPMPPVPEFVARRGTGFRHRVRRWPTSVLTGRQVKFVPPTFHPEKKTVFVIGCSHLRGLVDKDVVLPKVPLSFSFLSVPGGGAADLKTEVGHLEFTRTPDVVCVLAPSNDLNRGPLYAGQEFGTLLTSVRSRWPNVFVLDFPPRLNKPVGLQDQLRQEHHRVATRMGLPFVAVASSFPLDRLELWCSDGVHLSDTGGSPILVKLLCDAALTLFAPDPPASPSLFAPDPPASPSLRRTDGLDPRTCPGVGDEGKVACITASAVFWRKMAEQQSWTPMPPVPEFVTRGLPILAEPAPPSPWWTAPPAQVPVTEPAPLPQRRQNPRRWTTVGREGVTRGLPILAEPAPPSPWWTSPPAQVPVTGPAPLPQRRQNPRRWTTVGREGKAGTQPVQQSLPIPSNPVWFSSPMLDAMEKFAPSSDSDCPAVPPPSQTSPGRCRRRCVANRRAGRREQVGVPIFSPYSAFTQPVIIADAPAQWVFSSYDFMLGGFSAFVPTCYNVNVQ
ncbi:uncharacterized protein LOC133547901 [Nerophis ophidion]|uniref:uncharacterized protein LOC133547901 n=1 Tax=Nerophis ophidion TaxID=159077 RepID=UPI002ADF2EFA|nr:uncharacterized protein LOC133547901 [Nerophis ophidion]